jgi:ammonia channel protein AmtB
MAMKNTIIASASAALTALFIYKFIPFFPQKWSFIQTINAALAGVCV